MGICGAGPAGLVERKTGFKEIVDRMGRWPGYGGSAVAYGRMAGLWGSDKTYGKTAIPYGEMACVGGRRIAWGSRENVWEMPRDMGTCAGTWGGRQAAWGAKIALKPGIWERWRPAALHVFMNFWREAAARHSLPSRLRTGPAANVAAPKIPRLRHLALASS